MKYILLIILYFSSTALMADESNAAPDKDLTGEEIFAKYLTNTASFGNQNNFGAKLCSNSFTKEQKTQFTVYLDSHAMPQWWASTMAMLYLKGKCIQQDVKLAEKLIQLAIIKAGPREFEHRARHQRSVFEYVNYIFGRDWNNYALRITGESLSDYKHWFQRLVNIQSKGPEEVANIAQQLRAGTFTLDGKYFIALIMLPPLTG